MTFFLKIICIIGIVLIASLLGFAESHRLKLRVRQLEAVIRFFQLLEDEIRYAAKPVAEIIAAHRETLPLCAQCHAYLCRGESFPQSWKKALQECTTGLTKQDRRYLEEFGDSFGAMDRDGQIQDCHLTKTRLETQLSEARETEEKKARLYRSLGVLCGFAVLLAVV